MALSTPYVPTGEFVPVREWSCPVHDDDIADYEEYGDPWESPGELCLDCLTGVWRDKKDENGEVVMRELSPWDLMFRDYAQEHGHLSALSEFILKPHLNAKTEWLEDEAMPRVRAGG